MKNAERFTGFSDIYDQARPKVPLHMVEIILRYLGRKPETVIDLGCGTGLSTMVWKDYSTRVIGIEPSEDMLKVARTKEKDNVSFLQGSSYEIGVDSADVIICSQSFHWMEPKASLREIARVLTPSGIFAAVDCDWPPVLTPDIEQVYGEFDRHCRQLANELEDVRNSFTLYPKEKHLEHIAGSGYFRYAREIVFSNEETFDAKRLILLLKSQGNYQAIKKRHPELVEEKMKETERQIHRLLDGKTMTGEFCYRMRIGVKKA